MATLVSPGVSVTVIDGDGHPLVWIHGYMRPFLEKGKWKSSDDLLTTESEFFKWFDTGWYVWRGKWHERN